MLVSSIARFNRVNKINNTQMQQSANSFNGIQNQKTNNNPFSFNLKSIINKLNILA